MYMAAATRDGRGVRGRHRREVFAEAGPGDAWREGRSPSLDQCRGFACLRHSPKHPSKGVGQLLKDDIILNYQLLV